MIKRKELETNRLFYEYFMLYDLYKLSVILPNPHNTNLPMRTAELKYILFSRTNSNQYI